MEIQKDFKALRELFNAHKVEYLIVGGYATAFHGAPRFTGDIDLLVSTDEGKMTFNNKVLFLVDLKKQLGDQKIDVVFDKENKSNQFFLKTIKQKSTQLC